MPRDRPTYSRSIVSTNHPNLEAWEHAAREYLAAQLQRRAPQRLQFLAAFDEQPLEGEGAVGLFEFEIAPASAAGVCAASDTRHYVVVGQTEPNYSPSFGLEADDAYSLHIGTRFMLTVGVQRLEPKEEPPALRDDVLRFIQGCNPHVEVQSIECELLLRCEEQWFAVYRVRLGGTDVRVVGGDLPTGFYDLADRPPQVVLRLHLGKLIRVEAREERDRPV